jgi:hypothetical protein
MTRYVTEIANAGREPEELQVMHSYPKREPPVKTEAAQLGGSGPRPDQHHGEDRSMAQRIAWPPTRAELDEMTSRTEKVMADPDTTLLDRLRAVEREQLVHNQYLRQSGADAELQRDAEAEWEAGT